MQWFRTDTFKEATKRATVVGRDSTWPRSSNLALRRSPGISPAGHDQKGIMRKVFDQVQSRSFEEIVSDWASFDEGVITFHTFTEGPYYSVSYELIDAVREVTGFSDELIEKIKRKLAKPKDVIIDDNQAEMELAGKGAN